MTTVSLQVAAAVGLAATLVAAAAYVHRYLQRACPRERTRLDPRTYRGVRAAVALGLPVGAVGALLSMI